MAQVLRRLDNLTPLSHPDLLIGIDGSDDAGVFQISDSVALVQTVDFFTPIVDEADDWGRIAVANALSDVYAMGGTPITALQLVGWPRDVLPFDLLGDVLVGAATVLEEAGVTLLGTGGLTAVAFITRKDFSFLRGILMWLGVLALVAIVGAVIFGFALGTWFSVAMIGFAGAAVLYDTSNILHHYPENKHVAAALGLFASIALMFWYVLQLFMSRD